jgi:L-asparaginase
MSEPRTLIIYTGGTIGMVPSENGYIASAALKAELQKALPEKLQGFDWLQYETLLDSSHMGPKDWNRIGKDIADHYDSYDGFVVLHGTDTMAYTASALSYSLVNLDKPVVLTGAQVSFFDHGSDALGNVALALKTACSHLHEVSLCFDGKILRGNRALKIHTISHAGFGAPSALALDGNDKTSFATGDFRFAPLSEQAVAVVQLYPNMGGAELNALVEAGVKGVVLMAFGSGNLPSHNANFMAALSRLSKTDALIGVTSQCQAGPVSLGFYAAGKAAKDLELVSLGDMTVPASVTKIGWLLNQPISLAEMRAALGRPLNGDMSL